MIKKHIATEHAPAALGPYSQAIQAGNTVYTAGQIPLDPQTMQLVEGDIRVQAQQVFTNLQAVCQAAGGDLTDSVKVNISLVDLNDFDVVNEVMKNFFSEPYPARACVQVSALPKGARIEVEAILVLSG